MTQFLLAPNPVDENNYIFAKIFRDFENVDISGFAPGVYIMKVTLENGKVFEEKNVKE